jgi:hypothetical protein
MLDMKPICALIVLAFAQAVVAAPPVPRPIGMETAIPLIANGVEDFEARDEDRLWIRDFGRRWYLVTLEAPCAGLPYAPGLGFKPRGSNALDKAGAILNDGDVCEIRSVVTSDPPPKKEKKRKILGASVTGVHDTAISGLQSDEWAARQRNIF